MQLDQSEGHHLPPTFEEFDPFFDLWFEVPAEGHQVPQGEERGIEDLVEMLYR